MLERIGDWMEANGDMAAFVASVIGIICVFVGMATGAFE